jgi:hypothetical protein
MNPSLDNSPHPHFTSMQDQNYRLENIAWSAIALTLRVDYYQFQQDEQQGVMLDEGK